MFLRYLEILAIILFIILFATQVLVPLFMGTKVFPLFRSSNRRVLEKQLTEVGEKEVEAELQSEIKARKEALKKQK